MTRSPSRSFAGLAGLVVMSALLVTLPGAPAGAADACVSGGEYAKIHSGMTIQKLAKILDGQTPLVDQAAQGKQAVRWYAACDGWDPVNDVVVRYHQQVVGRRTVIGKKLDVYVA
jgi:hypothetical protein